MPALIAVAMAAGAAPAGRGASGSTAPQPRATSRSRRIFTIGVITGTVYFAGTLYWIVDVLVSFGGLARPVAILANLLLILFLALFPALALQGVGVAVARWGAIGLLWTPAIWVTAELARTYLFGGFPWVLLGYSQATVLPVAQLASVTGVYGMSGLVAAVSALLAWSVLESGRRRGVAAAAAIVLPLVVAAWGAWRLAEPRLAGAGDPLRVGLIQGNVAQDEKWDPARRQDIFDAYLRMSREAASRGAELVVWPESSTPFVFEEDRPGSAAIQRLVRDTGIHLLLGSNQVERGASGYQLYNAAFLVRPDGRVADVYRKIHLVPFGEYVPFGRLLFFARPLVESAAAFSPGDEAVVLPVSEHLASTAICYEVVYPALIDRFVDAGSQLLTTITNDAWYGLSSAPHQHFEQAGIRAIEQGRYLVRAANTGISGVVDPYGRVLERSAIFEPATIVADVRFLEGRTVYGIVGDLFAYLCTALTIAMVAVGRASSGRRASGARRRAS